MADNERRNIMDEPSDLRFLGPAEKTAAAPGGTLWRGLHIPYVQSPVPSAWLKNRDRFAEKRLEIGPILLDAIQRGHWDVGSRGETATGRHWSTDRGVSARFAREDEKYSLPILLEAEWDGTGEDPDRTNVGGDFPGEAEVTLLPGTPLRITKVHVMAFGLWWPVLADEEYRVADVRTAAEPGGVLPYEPSTFGYRWDQTGPDQYETETRDNISYMKLFVSPGSRSAEWRVYDDMGLVESGIFSGYGSERELFEQADRTCAQFDTRPAIPPKDFTYREDYTETPDVWPNKLFEDPYVPSPEYE